jgi:Cu-Zn family superoxide dismutase
LKRLSAFESFVFKSIVMLNLYSFLKLILTAGIITLFSFFSCNKPHPRFNKAEAILSATKADTTVMGRLSFTEVGNNQVSLDLEVTVPQKAGSSVAIHLHEHGMCGNAGGDAHGHWNPTGKAHGKWGSEQFHAGDIGNISLDAQGRGRLTLVTHLWSIGGADSTNILNRGVIVHSGVDNYASQPAGSSGPRIGCGVIVKKID